MTELKVQAAVENIPEVTAFVDGQLEAIDCPMKAQMQIDVAIDELFGNIAHYAYGGASGEAAVQFHFDADTRMISIAFVDSGTPFDPLSQEDPDVTLSAEERGIGGLGIFLVRKTMDQITYKRDNGQNVLTIYKKI